MTTSSVAFRVICFCLLPIVTDAQVELAWTARFSGPSNVIDQARAISVDREGNTFVTGGADRNGPSLGGDIVTVKYDPSGALVWTARYENPGALADAPTAMTIDAAGYIYITGYSHGHPSIISSQDYVTLKYSPDGTQVWAARYSGPTNSPSGATSVDYPRAIVVDSDGQVYVTGLSSDSGGNARDYATVKYDADGNQLWAAIYDSPDHASDSATSLAVSTTGEVYVGGLSGVVKYAPNGNQLWVRPATANDLALDAAGNLVVVGPSFLEPEDEGEEPDVLVTKYSSAGNYLWSTSYDGAIEESDSATHVRIDGAGNIYVTGNSASRCIWREDEGHEEKVCDTAIVTLKLDSIGRQLWAARYAGSESMYFPIGLELDETGNAYVLGSEGPWSRTVTLKYAANGTREWARVYSDTNHGWDSPAGIALGSNGDVHVGGSSHWRDGASSDYFVLKYVQHDVPGFPEITVTPHSQIAALGSNVAFVVSASGAEPLRHQWLFNGEPIGGATNVILELIQLNWQHEGDYSVEISNSVGSVVSPDARLELRHPVQFYGQSQEHRVIVGDSLQFEFAVSGLFPITYQWLFEGTEIPGATNTILRLTNLQASQSGIYTLRAVDPVSGGTSPEVRLMVTALASRCWESRPPGDVSGNFESGGKVVLDAAGNVYAAASLLGVIKYDNTGSILWSTPYPGEVQGIALDGNGNVFVTGFQRGHDDDYLTVKYGPNGSTLWSRVYDGPANDIDRATGIKVDHDGKIIVTGWAIGSSGGTEGRHQDYVTIKYDQAGNQLWRAVYDSPDHRQDMAYALDIDSANNIYVTGQSPAAGTRSWDAATIKYAPDGTQLWVAFHQSPATNAAGRDVKVDGAGNILIGGAGWGLSSRADGFITKYASNGQQLWTVTYNGPGNWYDSFNRVVLDSAGNVFACGSASRGNSYAYDAILLKFDPNGRRLWTARYDSGSYNSAKDVALDAAGNAYMLTDAGTLGRNSFAAIKFDSHGNRRWESKFFEQDHSWPGSIAVNETGDVFVTGATDKDAAAWNLTRLVTLKYCQDEVSGAPNIVHPPSDLTVTAGSSGSFEVIATGAAPLSYRWGFHRFPIQMLGETGATLVLTNAQAWQDGDYFVEVCNNLGCVVSPVARLTVQPAQPKLHSPWKASHSFGFQLESSPAFPLVVETSTDLQVWTILSTNNGPSLNVPMTTNGPARFFRARSLSEISSDSSGTIP